MGLQGKWIWQATQRDAVRNGYLHGREHCRWLATGRNLVRGMLFAFTALRQMLWGLSSDCLRCAHTNLSAHQQSS
jgi:hypothetical protein